MAYQAQYESGRATVTDDPYDNAFAESLWIEPPKRPLKGGIVGGWRMSKC